MTDKISLAVTLAVALTVVVTMYATVQKIDDPEYMCESALGEGWKPAQNETNAEGGWVCEAPNGTIRTVRIQNVTSNSTNTFGGRVA